MPKLSQWFIRLAFAHLMVGTTLGAIMLAGKGIAPTANFWWLLPWHIESLLWGWVLNLVLGTAFWIVPRFWQAPHRGNERGAYVAFYLLNGGIALVWLAAWLRSDWLMFAGRLGELTAVFAFAHHLWPRIRAFQKLV